MTDKKMLIVDKMFYNDIKYALCAVFGEGAHYIDNWDFLQVPPPKLGDCKGCIHFHQEIFSSRCQKCLRMNGIVDYYVKSKIKVDG